MYTCRKLTENCVGHRPNPNIYDDSHFILRTLADLDVTKRKMNNFLAFKHSNCLNRFKGKQHQIDKKN